MVQKNVIKKSKDITSTSLTAWRWPLKCLEDFPWQVFVDGLNVILRRQKHHSLSWKYCWCFGHQKQTPTFGLVVAWFIPLKSNSLQTSQFGGSMLPAGVLFTNSMRFLGQPFNSTDPGHLTLFADARFSKVFCLKFCLTNFDSTCLFSKSRNVGSWNKRPSRNTPWDFGEVQPSKNVSSNWTDLYPYNLNMFQSSKASTLQSPFQASEPQNTTTTVAAVAITSETPCYRRSKVSRKVSKRNNTRCECSRHQTGKYGDFVVNQG